MRSIISLSNVGEEAFPVKNLRMKAARVGVSRQTMGMIVAGG